MKLGKRKPSGLEKDEAAIQLLEQLREKLYSEDSTTRRCAAYKLSWMQEDGLDILKEALFGRCPKKAKTAAAYGMRRMLGRMKKKAREVLDEGVKHTDKNTRQVCSRALMQLSGKIPPKRDQDRKDRGVRIEIREIPSRTRPRRESPMHPNSRAGNKRENSRRRPK